MANKKTTRSRVSEILAEDDEISSQGKFKFTEISPAAGPYPPHQPVTGNNLQFCLDVLGTATVINFWSWHWGDCPKSKAIVKEMKKLYYELVDTCNKEVKDD